jgi:iron(II)-dependent oxidoreductase
MTRAMDARELGGTLAWKDPRAGGAGDVACPAARPPPARSALGPGDAALPAHVPGGLGRGPCRQLRGAVAPQALGEPGFTGPETDRLYDAFRTPRRIRGELPLLGAEEAMAYAEQVRARALRRLERLNRRGRRAHRSSPGRRLRLRHGGPARAAARRDADRHPAAGHLHRARPASLRDPAAPRVRPRAGGSRSGRALPHGHRTRRGPTTTSGHGTGRRASLLHRPLSGHQGQFLAFMEDGGYANRAHWAARAGRFARRSDSRIRCSGGARAVAGSDVGSAPGSRCRRTSRCVTSAGTRRTRTRDGRGVDFRPRPSGRRRPPRLRRKVRRYPWGDAPPDLSRATSGPRRTARSVGAFAAGQAPSVSSR